MYFNGIEFRGKKQYLSNMFFSPFVFRGSQKLQERFHMFDFNNFIYPTAEHLFQNLKSNDIKWTKIVLKTKSPYEVKKLNRKFLTLNKKKDNDKIFLIRKDWEEVKLDAMKLTIFLKFSQNKELHQKLLKEKGDIIERNNWNDVFWGVCNNIGKNNLGKILMEYRDFYLKNKINLTSESKTNNNLNINFG